MSYGQGHFDLKKTLTLYGIGIRNRGMTLPRPVGRTSKYRLKVKYSIEVSSGFESPAPNLEASVRFLWCNIVKTV